MTALATQVNKPHSVALTLLAGLPLFTLLPLGLDIFLPALFQIGEYFQSQQTSAMAISIYLVFWGLGQLFWGGLADKYGNKTIAIIGLVAYAVSAYLIYNTSPEDGTLFLAFRAMQSFGGSACFTAIYALIRTRFEGQALNQAYSYLNGILAFIPVSAPLAGAFIVETAPWNSLFALMALLGALSVIWIMVAIPAEPKKAATAQNTAKEAVLKTYLNVLASTRFRTFLSFALVAQCLFIYFLSVAPMYLMGKLKVSQVDFGQYFMIIAGVFMLCSFAAPKVSQKMKLSTLMAVSFCLVAMGGGLMLLFSSMNAWYAFIGPMVLVAMGCTFILSNCPANALADFKQNAGVASGLYTAINFGGGAAIAGILVKLIDSTDLATVSLVYTLLPLFTLIFLVLNKTINAVPTEQPRLTQS